MKTKKEEKIYQSFVISICLIVGLSISGIFLGMTIRTRHLIQAELVAHARAYFGTIVATRLWNAHYGGVYVEKKTGVESNPYIEKPDIRTVDGRVFTIRNPAMMTREVSEYVGTDKDFRFHITSKKLVNPNNRPDPFEARALDSFEKGVKEVSDTEKVNGKPFFRYMAPLYISEPCLQCHWKQGYKVGDVRGGISISYNVESVDENLRTNTVLIVVSAVATTLFLIAALLFMTKRLIRKIAEIRQQLEIAAVTDGLTAIYNRRHLMERFEEEFSRSKRANRSLSCIMFDIDHFKSVNDKYGHLVGDDILIEISNRIKDTIRNYDVLGRFGGEEFMVVLPDTPVEDATHLAERMRKRIYERTVKEIPVSISLGVAQYIDTDKSVDDIVKRADQMLYEAKGAGRNCVRSDVPLRR